MRVILVIIVLVHHQFLILHFYRVLMCVLCMIRIKCNDCPLAKKSQKEQRMHRITHTYTVDFVVNGDFSISKYLKYET